MIIGWDFLKRFDIVFKTQPLSLYIEGDEVQIAELSREEVIRIAKLEEEKTPVIIEEEKVQENIRRKCQGAETVLLKGNSMGYVVLETTFKGNKNALFEPVVGPAGSELLFPGIVSLEKDRNGNRARFVVKYMNFKSEDVTLEAGRTVGFIQTCDEEKIEGIQIDERIEVAAISERTEKERLQEMFLEVDQMLEVGSKENEVLKTLLKKYPQVFSTKNDSPSITPYYCHTIQLQSTPKYKKPYITPACFHDKVKEQIKDMIHHGIIRPSRSPFHSPLVPVAKKDGTIRLCVDYRNLNTHIISDSFPLPNINQILQNLGKGKIFSCLDLRQGYHQIPLIEESKPLTAFIAPGGLYEYNVMPMGLKDSPAAFSRIISQVLVGLIGNNTYVYIDDIIVQGEDLEDHINNLEKTPGSKVNTEII